MTSVLGVIPARYASTRFPGKPLALIQGIPMIEWVHRAAKRALKRVVVATDDQRIFKAVINFGGVAVMTPASCASGTDRIAFVAKKIPAAYYVNIQGDEPLIRRDTILKTLAIAQKYKAVATAATDLKKEEQGNPNVVKVVTDENGRALYFSRSLIPFPRKPGLVPPLKHLGLYIFPRKMLFEFVKAGPVKLERAESLEQLRALYLGMPIFVARTRFDTLGVDTPADLEKVKRRLKES